MVPAQELILAHLETDDTLTSYFRVRPLLSPSGDIRAQCLHLWPEYGCLRVVPDSGEQSDFRERLRTLGEWCLLDLKGQKSDCPKIRLNRNYVPGNGNRCQYIVYSDVIRPVGENGFYSVIDAAPELIEEAAACSVTPSFFLRTPEGLLGPISRTEPVLPQEAPQHPEVFSFLLPSGETYAFVVRKQIAGCDEAVWVQPPLREIMARDLKNLDASYAKAQSDLAAARRKLVEVQAQLQLKTPHGALLRLEALKNRCSFQEEMTRKLKAQIASLTEKRNTLYQSLAQFTPDTAGDLFPAVSRWTPLPLAPAESTVSDPWGAIRCLSQVLAHAGVSTDPKNAADIFLLLSLCDRVTLVTSQPAAAATLCENLVSALGWSSGLACQTSPDERPIVLPGAETPVPAVLVTLCRDFAKLQGAVKIMITGNQKEVLASDAYRLCPWPILTLPALPFIEKMACASTDVYAPAPVPSDLTDATALLRPIHTALCALSGDSEETLLRFAACAAPLMEGGIHDACDEALRCFVIPAITGEKPSHEIELILSDYPRARAAFEESRGH